MFAAVHLSVITIGLTHIAAGLFDHVGGVEPTFEMAAAELALLVLLVAGPLEGLLVLDPVFG
jgi:hypothetical protein